ncbi:type VI secretion system tip protein TssI/VgrG [Pokkaliibacter sp. MBI-7]|uniref:type VI secretion system Vgr family protein n=1 Tax=Pokkaliibacter sp. MBI-7 TaxID=3040600 RepID=UPI0024471AFB|nr:type VI secretion system tip protein TssI/VgrG [Pokkaliibacter sp. MBI-7]MDH2432959.1 type VI secretion system tip protein TssI/VgrG [Pokkaliibacter sp. MBI-7]
MRAVQSSKNIFITTPLGQDALILDKATIHEGLSQLSHMTAFVHTNSQQVDPHELLGKAVTLTIPIHDDHGEVGQQLYNAVVTRIASKGSRTPAEALDEVHRDYELTLQPQAYFLTQRRQNRIFQQRTPLDIVTQILSEHSVKFEDRTSGSFPTFEYKVQFDETDWNFVCRLLQHEGVFFYFEHSAGDHTLVLADDSTVYTPCLEQQVAYFTGDLAESHLYVWSGIEQIATGKVRQQGYNFLTPTALAKALVENPGQAEQQGTTESVEYIAEAENISRTQATAQTQLDALQHDQLCGEGKSNCRSFRPGGLFSFKRHEDKREEGKSYVVTRIKVEASSADNQGEQAQEGDNYKNEISVLPADAVFRPRLARDDIAAREGGDRNNYLLPYLPRIFGSQTARVVAEANSDGSEEVHIDKYGRVHVCFHWDLEQRSSCWIRVAQAWAGNGRGAFFFPRIGDEVIVQYLSGDPDQPVIVGSLYNGTNPYPTALPESKTQSGFISRSSKGGGKDNYNALVFEDLKGQELFYTQAEKDQQALIKNNQLTDIGMDRQTTIKNNDVLDVGKVFKLKAGSEIVLEVGGSKLTMKSDGTITLSGNKITEQATQIIKQATSIKLNG